MRASLLCAVFVCLGFVGSVLSEQNVTIVGQPPFDGVVRKDSDGSYYAFMKPPFASNHASSIEVIPLSSSTDGLGVAWFSGVHEEANKCAIVFSRLTLPPSGSSLDGSTWSDAVLVSQQSGYSDQNPVVYYDTSLDVLNVYHSHAPAESGESASAIWHTTSSNGGRTWAAPKSLIDAPGAFPRNRIIPSTDGSLIFPYYNASGINYSIIGKSGTGSSRDVTWTPFPIKNSQNLVQPTVVRLTPKEPNKLKVWFRDRRAQSIYEATSEDEGKTWETPYKSTLPNNNAGIEAFQLSSGNTVIVFNDYSGKGPRTPLTIALSEDHGTSWPYKRNLQVKDDVDMPLTGIEYSYPSVLEHDGVIHVTYTYDRLTIKYRAFTEDWIKKGTQL